MIRFHILGAGGALPTITHNPAAYWADVDGDTLLVDPGPGALVRLARAGLLPAGIDTIERVLLTHLHPDHSLDLIALLFALHSPLPERTDALPITGPPGLCPLLESFRGIYGRWLEPRRRALEVCEITPGAEIPLPRGGVVRAFAVDHPQDRLSRFCLGFQFSDREGRRVVYSGDTGPSAGLEEAAREADLLVVECSTPEELATQGHLTPGQVGRLCAAARPHRVVLTHQYPPAAALDLALLVGEFFDGPVVQAADGDVFEVPTTTGDPAC